MPPKTPNNLTYNKVDFLKKFINHEDAFKNFEDVVNSDLALNREIFIGGVDEQLAESVDTLIRFWNKVDDESGIEPEDRKPIKMYINSWGGSLVGAYTIINSMELSKTPIWTINIGAAYSAGFFIFITGSKRFAYPLSSFLYHEGSTGSDGFEDAHKFRNRAEFYTKQLEQLKRHVLTYTAITEEKYQTIIKDDFWLTARDALELNVCDQVMREFI